MAGLNNNPEAVRKLLENLQSDLKNISLETKKKHPSVKESAEEAIVKIRNASGASSNTPLAYLSNQILYPLVQGCETKDTKVVNLCLQVIQRLITSQVLDGKGAKYVVETMWMLMEANIEEVRLLQTLTLLVTTNSVCCADILARCLVICFRLAFSKDNTIAATGGATVRHLVSAVFDRAVSTPSSSLSVSAKAPSDLPSSVSDAYLLFQDLVQLVNADQPLWLLGIVEMTRTFGLELLESLLLGYSPLFYKYDQFRLLLKERVCSLVIKLFSPNIKYRGGGSGSPGHSPAAFDKPYYPISLRLLRVVCVLVEKYYKLLITESEIFLSLIVKFLDPDKPSWQRALALELLHKIVVQPKLLTEFCRYYDCQPHATNIFQDMINSLGAYVQNMFISQNHIQQEPQEPNRNQSGPGIGQSSSQPGLISGLPMGPGVSAQPGFYYRGCYQPLTLSWLGGTAKCQYLDMTERMEPPQMQEGYGVSLAYGCLLDVVRSVSLVVDTTPEVTEGPTEVTLDQVRSQMLTSSWCGLLSAMALLLDAATEDATAENILKSMCVYSSLAARLELPQLRDSYITAVCKASLPPHYTLSVLKATPSTQLVSGGHHDPDHGGDVHDYRHQVVAVGTPLPSASLPPAAQQGPVMLTAKNLQCMRSILSICHCHGDLLGPAWHIVLTTLQHLVWILGLKPSSGHGGQLRAGRSGSNETSAVLTTAVQHDLPVLANMLTSLFEATSCSLSDESLTHLIQALIIINTESLALAMNNREPSLFAVAKLLETGLVNMSRVETWWVVVTSHLLEACSHPHTRMREWSAEAVCVLIQASLRHQHEDPPLASDPKLQTLLLSPLVELSAIPHPDIRARQLDCVMQILHSSAERLTQGWPLLITVIGSLRPQHPEAVVKTAFQALQLVLTDFLPLAPHNCLPLAVHTAAKFGSQTQDLNISLTAVGLLWNLSDYFYQNQDNLKTAIIAEPKILPDLPGYKEMTVFDKLWMCLFSRLGDLCLDPRPATRKSAGQTLFSTIAAHGSLLAVTTWRAVLWQVLFPLLDKVGIESGLASTERSHDKDMLIHHSRNTEQKQWSETQVLTISGVARVFVTKRSLLHTLGDFPKAWRLLLEHVEKLALSSTQEVSLAALKAFHEMVVGAGEGEEGEWAAAWRSWLAIGQKVSQPRSQSEEEGAASQAFLTALYHIFPLLHPHICTKLTPSDVTKLTSVTMACLALPVQADSELGFLMTLNDESLLPLHSSIIKSISAIETFALSHNISLVPPIFSMYLQLSKLVHTWPAGAHQCAVKGMFPEKYILLGERSMMHIARLFEKTHSCPCVLDNLVLLDIVNTIKTPLVIKYKCIKQSSWQIAMEVMLNVLENSLGDIKEKEKFADVWTSIQETFDAFLFPSVKPPNDRTPDKLEEDEAIDCSVIEFLKNKVLDQPSLFPHSFILSIMVILNKGSIHSHYNGQEQDFNKNTDAIVVITMREDFAKICFETLLQYSLLEKSPPESQTVINGNGSIEDEASKMMTNVSITEEDCKVTNKLAVTSLLHRFQDVLCKYIADEKLSSPVPLPSHRVAELSFVLKALTTLISSLKQGQRDVDGRTWSQVIGLYPHLVQATSIYDRSVSSSLQQALHQYKDLLQPPSHVVKNSSQS